MKNSSIVEDVYVGMHARLQKIASGCCQCESCDDGCKCEDCSRDCSACSDGTKMAKHIMGLTSLSESLDNLGLEKSAENVLYCLATIADELSPMMEKVAVPSGIKVDEHQVSDQFYQVLKELSQNYPDLKRDIKSILTESPLGDYLEPEDEFSAAPTVIPDTESPPSHMLNELPLIPPPSSVESLKDLLQDEEIQKIVKDIEDTPIEVFPNENKTVPAPKEDEGSAEDDILGGMEKALARWKTEHPDDVLNLDFEDEEDEE